MFTLEIKSTAATTHGDGTPDMQAIAQLLRQAAEKVDKDTHLGVLRDGNGNAVGGFSLTD